MDILYFLIFSIFIFIICSYIQTKILLLPIKSWIKEFLSAAIGIFSLIFLLVSCGTIITKKSDVEPTWKRSPNNDVVNIENYEPEQDWDRQGSYAD